MSTELNNTFFPFEDFIEKLRENGFPVGVHTYIQVHTVLNQLDADTPAETLKTILAPLFAKNDRDQARFYRFFDSYFTIVEDIELKVLGQIKQTETTDKSKRKSVKPVNPSVPTGGYSSVYRSLFPDFSFISSIPAILHFWDRGPILISAGTLRNISLPMIHPDTPPI
ncbi:MAG: hypothetical protein R3C61_00145 [Bacteroidia bacterium]